jgi:cytochrome c peroxidase
MAITGQEAAGYRLFKTTGCTACHNGPAVAAGTFQKFGIVERYATDNPAAGRVAVTGQEADRQTFKVPTLRNIELTYPYFHDGGVNTLGEAVETMARVQLGRHFTPEENATVVAFLRTLTGDQPSFALPLLPRSSDTTPRPAPFK